MSKYSKPANLCAAVALDFLIALPASADPLPAGTPFLNGGTFVDAMSKGMRDTQRSGPAVRMKVRSHEMFYQLSLRMSAEQVVQILGLPEKQNVYQQFMPVDGSDKVASKTLVCFGYDNVVAADKSIEKWVAVFDESGLRGWAPGNLDGCNNR